MHRIEHWNEKKQVIPTLLDMENFRELLERSVKGPANERQERFTKLDDVQKRWNQHRPSAIYYSVISDWCEQLFGDFGQEAINFFIDSSMDAFVARAMAYKTLATKAWFETENTQFVVNRQIADLSIRTSMDRRRLDQRLFYMNADSAELWKATISAADYPVYRWCCESLEALVDSEEWMNLWGESGFEQLVSLGGGGAPDKDRIILNAITRNKLPYQGKVPFIHLDISMMMIKHSITQLRAWAPNSSALRGIDVDFRPIVADFTQLERVEDLLGTAGRSAWFFLGGTIGNIRERLFFDSLSHVSREGDVLVLGVDTYEKEDGADVAKTMREKYMGLETQKFAIAPLVRALGERDPSFSRQALANTVSVDVTPGLTRGYSDVDETMTVEMTATVKERKFQVLTSNRYAIENLISFCERHGWKMVRAFSPRDGKNTSFKNLLLKKM